MRDGTRLRARPASSTAHALAEGPVWDAPRGRLLWVDILAGHVVEGRLDGPAVTIERVQQHPGTVGALAVAEDGTLLVAEAKRLTVEGLSVAELIEPDTASRLNDGACDPAGRFVVGTLALDGRIGEERLLRLEHDGAVTLLDDDLTLSNGLGWSPDGSRMYSVDSVPGVLWARDYDAGSGRVGPREELLRIDDAIPDGLSVDADGNLWLALWGAGEVRCFSPDGTLLQTVAVDAPHVTSVAFVGPALDQLLISTARAELSDRQLSAYPCSGRLFLVEVGRRGLPATPWAGLRSPVPLES